MSVLIPLKKYLPGLAFIFLLTVRTASGTGNFIVASPSSLSTVYVSATEPECVQLAVQDLVNDIEKIAGRRPEIVKSFADVKGGAICIGTFCDPSFKRYTQKVKIDLTVLKGQWETFKISSFSTARQEMLVIAGSDERGTMFGIYDFIEKYLGVDPMYFWSGLEPQKKSVIELPSVNYTSKEPTFKFRGWFINDEDLLSEWKDAGGRRNIDYPYYQQVVAPEVMEHVVEALVRLKYNLIIPASFLDIGNPAEEELVKVAARRGVFLSQHHIEPLGVSGFTFFNYWKAKDGSKPLFSYYSSKEKLLEVWTEYAKKWAKYPNVIWQIGLRGVGDRPMWLADPNVPQSDADRGRIISDALVAQMEIIKKVDKRTKPLITTTLWAEGSNLFNEGFLKIPEQAIIVFSDNSPGWKLQDDFYSVRRDTNRRYGVYYHHQLWGSGPHLAQGVPPSRTQQVFGGAVEKGSTEFAILNASNIREFVLGLDATARILYDSGSFDPEKWMDQWCTKRFPSSLLSVKKLYHDYFSAFAIHDERKVPMALDGQSQSAANSLLKEITLYFSDQQKFRELQKPKVTKPGAEQSWGAKSLGDMHPAAKSKEEWLQKANMQDKAFSEVIFRAEQLLDGMQADESAFLQTNLLAHAYFMRGLSKRLGYVARGRLALDRNEPAACLMNLELAKESFSDFRKAKIWCSQGRWTDWYRGDKKMNLQRGEAELNSAIELVRRKM